MGRLSRNGEGRPMIFGLLFEEQRPQAVLALMQNPDDDYPIIVFQVKDAVIFAHKVSVFRMNRQQRVQRTTTPGELFEELDALFETGDNMLGSARIAQFIPNVVANGYYVALRFFGKCHLRHTQPSFGSCFSSSSPANASSMVKRPSVRMDSTPLASSASSFTVA